MKKYILLFLIFNINYAQNFEIKFQFQIKPSNDLKTTIKNFTLKQNNTNSIFELDDFTNVNQFKYKDLAKPNLKNDSIATFIINENIDVGCTTSCSLLSG